MLLGDAAQTREAEVTYLPGKLCLCWQVSCLAARVLQHRDRAEFPTYSSTPFIQSREYYFQHLLALEVE